MDKSLLDKIDDKMTEWIAEHAVIQTKEDAAKMLFMISMYTWKWATELTAQARGEEWFGPKLEDGAEEGLDECDLACLLETEVLM